MISQWGWRGTYGLMTAISLAVSGLIAVLVKEPGRGVFLSRAEK